MNQWFMASELLLNSDKRKLIKFVPNDKAVINMQTSWNDQ
jgi:hypothetical protein